MSNENEEINPPRTRKDKIEFLKAFMQGKATIGDLQETLKITLNLGPWDPQAQEEKRRKKQEELAARGLKDTTLYITLNL